MNFFNRRRKEQELDEELQFHLDEEAEQRAAQGLPADEARWAARRNLGSVALVKERTRDSWGLAALGQLARDFRYTVRGLRQNPGFVLTAIATLAIGIGINAMVFTVTNAVLFKGFPMVERPDRLLYLSSFDGCCVSYPDFLDWREQAKSFQGMALVHGIRSRLDDQGGIPEWFDVTEVSADTFKLVGQQPILGRDFTEADEAPGAAPVAILNYGFWERRFGKDPSVIGRSVRLNGTPASIIGVMPRSFTFPQKLEFWVPLMKTPHVMKRVNRNTWYAFGRLAEGVTAAAARAEMATIGKRLADEYPLTEKEFPPVVQTFTEFYLGRNAPLIYGSMWGAVGFVLLIACANLANLMLARSIGRSREISVRIALGAGRWRIIRQLLIESVLLSSIGGFFGWWLAKWGVRAYELAMVDHQSWLVVDYAMDTRILFYLIAISIATGILFGLAPAARLSKLDVNSTLKDGGRGSTGGGHAKRLSTILVITEVSLAVVLLAGAGVMIRSFLNIYNTDLGVDLSNTLQAGLELPPAKYPSQESRQAFFDHLRTRLEALPGIESIAFASRLPTWEPQRLPFERDGAPPVERSSRPRVARLLVNPAYFRTLRVEVVAGRNFTERDAATSLPVAIVNQSFAAASWPGESPLGKRLRFYEMDTPGLWLTVVGVTSNVVQSTVATPEFAALVYQPHKQLPIASMSLIARTRVPPETLTASFRREIAAIDPDLSVWNIVTLEQVLKGRYWNSQFYGALFLMFAAIALLLASVGLYAVIAHSVSQRTQEIGVRMALGGTASDIRSLVFKQGMIPVGIGLGAGLAASLAVNRLLEASLIQVSPSDPATLASVAVVLLIAATLGCLIPARRAMRVDPIVALRHD